MNDYIDNPKQLIEQFDELVTEHCKSIKHKTKCNDKLYCRWSRKGSRQGTRQEVRKGTRKRISKRISKRKGRCMRNKSSRGLRQSKELLQRNQDFQILQMHADEPIKF